MTSKPPPAHFACHETCVCKQVERKQDIHNMMAVPCQPCRAHPPSRGIFSRDIRPKERIYHYAVALDQKYTWQHIRYSESIVPCNTILSPSYLRNTASTSSDQIKSMQPRSDRVNRPARSRPLHLQPAAPPRLHSRLPLLHLTAPLPHRLHPPRQTR